MRVDVKLGLKDVPGMLVKALEPISAKGGNILSVLHTRGGRDYVGVEVVFTVKDEETLNRILSALKKEKVRIKDVRAEGRNYYRKKSLTFIFVGHVIDEDIQDSIDRLNTLGRVNDVDVRMTEPELESSVLMGVDVDEKKMPEIIEEARVLAQEKEFLLVREVQE